MVLNPSKYFCISFSSNINKSDLFPKDSTKIASAEELVVLGFTMDNRLTFYKHLKIFCKKIVNKLNVLIKTAPYLNHNQIRLEHNSFLRESLFFTLLFGHFVLNIKIVLLRTRIKDSL